MQLVKLCGKHGSTFSETLNESSLHLCPGRLIDTDHNGRKGVRMTESTNPGASAAEGAAATSPAADKTEKQKASNTDQDAAQEQDDEPEGEDGEDEEEEEEEEEYSADDADGGNVGLSYLLEDVSMPSRTSVLSMPNR